MSATFATARTRRSRDVTNLALWTLQGWLAMFFTASGYAKLAEPMTSLIELMVWPALVAEPLVRGLGGVEIGLAVLLLAPLISWKYGRPLLLAAAGALAVLEVTMLGVHALGIDIVPALTNVVLLALTLPVLWFRARPSI